MRKGVNRVALRLFEHNEKAYKSAIGLRISAKYNRIYVHRTTLKAIGNPEFVSLGIHPQSKKLVVLAAEECDKEAIRVRYTEDNMFCIYSKVLLDGICTVALQIGAQDSCLLHGRLMKEQNAASFDMNDIETITEAE